MVSGGEVATIVEVCKQDTHNNLLVENGKDVGREHRQKRKKRREKEETE